MRPLAPLAIALAAAIPAAAPAVPAVAIPVADSPAARSEPAAPNAQDQFEALVSEIGSLREELDKMDRHERSIVNEMDRLEVEAALRARELSRLTMMKKKAASDLEMTRERLRERREQVEREEAGLARQLRAAYEMGRSRELRLVLLLAEPVDVMRAIAYIDVMTERQSGVVASLKKERVQMEALERALVTQTGSLEELADQERARTAELAEVQRKSAALLDSTRKQADAHRRAIAELTKAATELESAIIAGTGAPGQGTGGRVEMPAIDVEKLRGALEWPVQGEIATPFGDLRDPRFGTVTPHAGVDVRTEPAAPIRAILPGRVAFARRFPGYGNTVLLDHGGGYLSVYARAAVMRVAEGDEVTPGQVLGISAEQAFDNGPPMVYFELRRDGRAIDPVPWLKKKAASRRGDDR